MTFGQLAQVLASMTEEERGREAMMFVGGGASISYVKSVRRAGDLIRDFPELRQHVGPDSPLLLSVERLE